MKGTKQEIRPGVWRLRVVDRYDNEGRPHQLSRTVNGTKRQAESALASFVAEVGRGTAPTSGGLTLSDYLTERWLPHVQATREPTTAETHSRRVAKIVAVLGHVPLAKLTAGHLDNAYREWGEVMAPGAVKAFTGTIGAALEQAVKWGLLPRNVARLATQPRVPKRRSTMPSLEEIGRLVKVAEQDDPILAMVIALAARTGMRRGELCGLRWRDLDDERLVLTVETAAKHIVGRTYTAETKTHRSRRFSIDAATVELLQAHRERMTLVGKGENDDFVFNWSFGRQATNPGSLTMRFVSVARKAGVECRLHDLRHAVASHLLGSGVDVVTAGRRMGFDPRTMLAIYAHGLEDADRAAAAVMGGLLAATNTSKLTL